MTEHSEAHATEGGEGGTLREWSALPPFFSLPESWKVLEISKTSEKFHSPFQDILMFVFI